METTENNPVPKYQNHHEEPYDKQLADDICALVASGLSLYKIEKMEGMPSRRTIRGWQKESPSFAASYNLAREERADSRVELLDEYSEKLLNGTIMPDVARVLIDTVKWQAGKENYRRYGDKQTIETTNTHTHNVVIADMSTASLLAELQRTAQALPGGVKVKGDKLEISTDYIDVTPKPDDKHNM